MYVPVLCLDGPSGAGKGTVAQVVAERLGWHYLDSGALYRLLGFAASEQGIALDDEAALAALAERFDVRFEDGHMLLDGRQIGDRIRTEEAGNNASRVAAMPVVRQALLEWQRRQAKPPGLVADGRDMGATVFPDSKCKVFLTASAEERAQRRYKQLREKGFSVTLARLFQEIRERDERDANRSASPLRPADDAVVLDTTELNIEQVAARVLELATERL
ncbi:MAG: (d)CMP kinase [Pseudomonadota bacterium]|nr:(d)CMP kinase [Pseudomonadota bacterium]